MSNFVPYRMPRYAEAEILKRARAMQEMMQSRRSVRSFSTRPINDRVIDALVKTAVSAPSGANLQPWHFCVVSNPGIKRKIRLAVEAEEARNYSDRFPEEWLDELSRFETNHIKQFLEDAPVLIVVFKQVYRDGNGDKKNNLYVTESVGIAVGILIAAIHNAGLATLPHTPNPMLFLNEILKRPDNERPMVILPVGYPADEAEVPDIVRKNPDEVISYYK